MLVCQIVFSQNSHKRVYIDNITTTLVQELATTGIDFRCGAVFEEEGVYLELSNEELELLESLGVPYTVTIDNLTRHYELRATERLPLAITAIEAEKVIAQTENATTFEDILTNPLQYDGCDEVDWAIPQNFNLGSMGGCLTVSEVEAELDEMRSLFPSLISSKTDASATNQTTYGNTLGSAANRWSGQTIWYVRITGNQSLPEGSKPQILYTSMIHSREVGSLMSNMYFMWYLLENYATDSAIKNLVDNNELYFIPVVNPDGLRWNEKIAPSGGGMQRKNLRVNSGDSGSTSSSNTTRGVDLNRNFDYFWGTAGVGSSTNPASDSYRGPSAASEPETQILANFVLARNFQTCIMNHTYSNAIPHPYGGNPSFVSGREDEMHRWHEDMTRYNRYVSGATIFTPANGIADDWMVGGNADTNGSTGSGKQILATTPEHGHGSEGGFWPDPTNIVPIAKRAMRIYFMNAYYGGKYARFHDLTKVGINSLVSDLTFGVDRLGQTDSDFTLTVTPASSNIDAIVSPSIQTGMSVLERRNLTAQLTLNSSIQPGDKIRFKVELKDNDNVVFYETIIEKYYQPTILFADTPDTDNLTNWNVSGTWTTSTARAWSGTKAIKEGNAIPYTANATNTLTTANSYDFSGYDRVIAQFYATWDIERNFDFVELLASTDAGATWKSVCGRYSKPKSSSITNDSHSDKNSSSYSFQANNSEERVYDADLMESWVMEEIIIDETHNSFLKDETAVLFRFNFQSDVNNKGENYSANFEGFYLDDFTITGLQIPCTIDAAPTNLSTSQITPNSVNLNWDSVASASYDLRYRVVGDAAWFTINNINTNNYTLTGLVEATTYEVAIATRCATLVSSFSSLINFTTPSSVACTGAEVMSFPYTESFETNLGLWSQGTNGSVDDIDWTSQSGTTLSGGTGPDTASNGIQYLYTEASTNVTPQGSPNKNAYLISPCFNFDGYEDAQLSFDYHMFGADMGSLSLEVSIDDGVTYTSVFSIAGQQHIATDTSWTTETVDLSLYDGQIIKLRFVGKTGSGYQSDMAIDNINISANTATLGQSTNQLEDLKIYPNPLEDVLFIKTPTNFPNTVHIKIMDVTGKVVLKENRMRDTSGIIKMNDITKLSTGSYFIKITDLNTNNQYVKLIIKK